MRFCSSAKGGKFFSPLRHDTLNRLQTLTPPVAIASGNFGFTYDALSRRTQMTRPNGLKSIYAYDNLSRLASVLHQSGTTTLDGAAYAVDNAGNRTSRTPQPSGTATNYGYDNTYQLLSATGGSTESYTYDVVGNRLTSAAGSYGYNTSNEMTSSPTATYTYDNNGNTVTKVVGSNTTTYAWDFENRMTSVTLPGSGGTVSFKYDPFGRRIYKSSSSGTSVFAYDGDNLAEETNASGTAVARYSQGLNIDEPLAMLRAGATSFYHADGLGSITSLSNTSATIAQTYTFDSFGNQTGSSGSLTNPFRYTAREFDSETSLYYYRARYYDQNAGWFLNEDPLRFNASANFYAYVDNDPVNWMDPAGLDKVEVCCRPLRKAKPFLMLWNHCYIKITDSNGNSHTWGILPDKKGVQKPERDNPRNSGGKCKNAPGEQCAKDNLRKALDEDYDSGTCPSCGPNYHNWWWRFAGYNSNTYVYNMISGYGLTPPPEPRSPGYNYAPGAWIH